MSVLTLEHLTFTLKSCHQKTWDLDFVYLGEFYLAVFAFAAAIRRWL